MPISRGRQDNEPDREAAKQIEKLQNLLEAVRRSVEISRQGFKKVGDALPGSQAEKEELELFEELQRLEARIELAIFNHQYSSYGEVAKLYREIFTKRLKP